jgi:hypothetical protein
VFELYKKQNAYFLRVLWGGQPMKTSTPMGTLDMIPVESMLKCWFFVFYQRLELTFFTLQTLMQWLVPEMICTLHVMLEISGRYNLRECTELFAIFSFSAARAEMPKVTLVACTLECINESVQWNSCLCRWTPRTPSSKLLKSGSSLVRITQYAQW